MIWLLKYPLAFETHVAFHPFITSKLTGTIDIVTGFSVVAAATGQSALQSVGVVTTDYNEMKYKQILD